MTSRRTKTWLFWLLPFFVLRSLVPVGFMLDTSGGGLSIVVCHGHVPAGQMGVPSAQAGANSDTGEQEKSGFTPCLFSVSAGAALAGAIATLPFTDAIESFAAVEAFTRSGSFGPARAQQSRAPPHFS